MSLASILNSFNNVGALTVTGPNNYAGQTGVYSARSGLKFATFDSVTSGTNAVEQWIANNTGSNAANSYTTVGEAGATYTGSQKGGIQWAHILGVDANTPITSLSTGAIASAAIQNEGITKSNWLSSLTDQVNGTTPVSKGNPITDFFSSFFSQTLITRIVLVALGLLLIAAGVFALTGIPQYATKVAAGAVRSTAKKAIRTAIVA